MSEQERTPFWQMARLILLLQQGWGYNASDLRRSGRLGLAIFNFLSVSLLAATLGGMGWASAQPAFGSDRSLARFAASIPPPLALSVIILAIMLCALGIIGILSLRRAQQSERALPITRYGYCFSTVMLEPLHLFALIGLTREQARWFHLPIDWDPTVEPGSDHYELIVNPATGYVERLRRIGAEPRELVQQPGAYTLKSKASRSGALSGEATAEQQVALTRAANRESMGWGTRSVTLRNDGITGIVIGLALFAYMIYLVLPYTLNETPQTLFQAHDFAPFVGLAWNLLMGGWILIVSARRLRVSSRLQYAEMAPPVVVEGEQACWAPFNRNQESLAVVRLGDDDNAIFRIPGQWKHRVRQPNARVRVTYNEQTWLVLDYRAVDAAPSRTSA